MKRQRNEKKPGKKLLRKLILPAVIVFLLLLTAAWVVAKIYVVRSVMVVGNRKVSSETIIEYSGVREGMHYFQIDQEKTAKNIQDHLLYIEYKSMSFDYKGMVTINVRERVGLAMLSEGGKVYVIDSTGMVLKVLSVEEVENGEAEGIPQVVGLKPKTYFNQSVREGVIWQAEKPEKLEALSTLLDALNEVGMLSRIKSVNVDDLDDIFVMTEKDMMIELGTIDEVELKLLIASAVLEQKDIPESQTGMTIDVGSGTNAHLIPAVHATRTPSPTATPAPTATPKPTRTPKPTKVPKE